jgi:hypothetical protein
MNSWKKYSNLFKFLLKISRLVATKHKQIDDCTVHLWSRLVSLIDTVIYYSSSSRALDNIKDFLSKKLVLFVVFRKVPLKPSQTEV